ncbi:MAG: beta-ketoacyl-[acyl-carrier-protein] synthase family protein [Pseudomonadales bacterium]|nr:beta-ketoacyl-[acyl-carrier-protein] synthase family protein [Pseudomonadales bacterium]
MNHTAVVTGIGAISPLGFSNHDIFNNLLLKKRAIKQQTLLEKKGFSNTTAAMIHTLDCSPYQLNALSNNRGLKLAYHAARQALEHAALLDSKTNQAAPQDMAIFLGTCMGESPIFERAAEHKENIGSTEADYRPGLGSVYTSALAEILQLGGAQRTYTCACASGNYSIGYAAELIQQGFCSQVLAGGVDSFSNIAHLGFMRSRAMSEHGCRPFDASRDGMTMSEGAAFLVIESKESAVNRGATIYAEIRGLGLSCDAYHPTAPDKTGSGMARAMESALKKASLSPEEITWVSAHGTGTPVSDAAECRAIETVFSNKIPYVSSIKGAIGHSLGAASALEAALCIEALKRQIIPPNVGLDSFDNTLGLAEKYFPKEALPTDGNMRYALNCAYGFGGMNSALVIAANGVGK